MFAAIAGPAVSLHLRTEALHQALNRPGPLGTAIEVNASWNTFTAGFTNQSALAEDDLSAATSVLASGFANSVPLAAGGWGGLTTTMHDVTSGTGPLPVGYHPELEVTYREQLTSNVQVIAGRVADAAIPPGVLGVAVTQQTAARYSLHPGSRLKLGGPSGKLGSPNGPIDLLVTAVVRARNPASTFWTADPLVTTPDLTHDLVNDQFSVLAGALADPGQLAAVQSAFCPAVNNGCDNMQLEWEFPVAVDQVNADQAQAFANALAVAAGSPYAGELQSVAAELAVTEPMVDPLTAFIAAQSAVLAVLLLMFASLAAIVVVVILLAARMVVARRDDELVMLRHRGASSRQIAMLILTGVAPAVIPAALAGAALAIAIIPGASITADWRQAAAVLAVALAGPPLIAVWRYRRPSPAVNPALILTPETRTRRASVAAQRRLVAGLTGLRRRGRRPGRPAQPGTIAGRGDQLVSHRRPDPGRRARRPDRHAAVPAGHPGAAAGLAPPGRGRRIRRPGRSRRAPDRHRSARLHPGPRPDPGRLRRHGQRLDRRRADRLLLAGDRRGRRHRHQWRGVRHHAGRGQVDHGGPGRAAQHGGVDHDMADPGRAAADQRGRGGSGRVRRDDRGHPVPPHPGERLRPRGQVPGQRRPPSSRCSPRRPRPRFWAAGSSS